jgi:hypothetical protein
MYLHPLIHTQLNRQRDLELPRRRPSLPSRQTGFKLGTLLIAILALLALSAAASAATAKKPPHEGYTLAEVQAAAVASADVSKAANKTYVAVKYPHVWGVDTLPNGNMRVELSIWIYGLVGLCYSRREKSVSWSRSTGWWQVRQRPAQQRRMGCRSSTVCGSVRPAAGLAGIDARG